LGAAADSDQAVVHVRHDVQQQVSFPVLDRPERGDHQRDPSGRHDVIGEQELVAAAAADPVDGDVASFVQARLG
jgi:hypothetical protein